MRLCLRSFIAACTLGSALARAEPVTGEQRALIAAAAPATAPAKPARPRQLLIYSETKGYRHASIEVGIEAITLMGARTGAYRATASEDPAALHADSLRGYDAVLFLNVTGNIFETVESQQALLDFVRRGGGVAGIHSATDACYDWPEWGAMFGGWFDGHPWNWNAHVTVWIEEPGHPLNAAFGGASSFAIQDEIYQLKGPDFRASHRVLASLDPRRTDMTLPGIKRADRDFPITLIREYGRGRVFYCSLGHNAHVYWNPAVLGHYLAGLQWVMGDLAGDAAPRARGALPPLAGEPQFWERLKATDYSADPRRLDWLDVAVAEAGMDAARRAELEAHLGEVFRDPRVPAAARQAAAQRLGWILAGNPARTNEGTVLALGQALRDPETVDWARLALDPVPGAEIDRLYVEVIQTTTGRVRLAAIQGAGHRRSERAVAALAPLLSDADPGTAAAAAWALGQIGGRAAEKALAAAPDRLAPAVIEAWLALAARAGGRAGGRIYESIYTSASHPDHYRATALRGLIASRPGAAVKYIQTTLSGNIAAFQQAALEAVATIPDRDVVRKLSAQLPDWTPEVQRAVIAAFGRRGDAAAVPALTAMLENEDPATRVAAIDALGRLPGSPETVQRLAVIAGGDGDDAKAAADALARIDGRGLDALFLERAVWGEAAGRPLFLRLLARRGQAEAVPQLLAMRAEADGAVRLAALEALGELATRAERAALLQWALQAGDTTEQNRAVRSLISEVLRDDDTAGRAAPAVAAIRAGDARVKRMLLPVLSRAGGSDALATLRELAMGGDESVARAAVSNLARWPDHAAVVPLTEVAESTGDAGVRQAAVAAASRYLEKERDAKELDETDVLGRLLALPGDAEVRKELLWLLSRSRDARAQALAEEHVGDPELGAAARDAVDAIRANREWPPAVTASDAAGEAGRIADGRTNTHWAGPAQAGVWIQVDLKQARPLRRLILDPARGSEHPEELQVFVSDDPAAWGEPRALFKGGTGRSIIELPPGMRGRHVRLVHTGSREDGKWSVAEIVVE